MFGGLAAIAALFGFVVTVLWLIIGWRAAVAHERIAAALEKLAQKENRIP